MNCSVETQRLHGWDIAACSEQGLRASNEDAHAVVDLGPDMTFFGVYDGHGGDSCSHFVRDNLHKQLEANKNFPSNIVKALSLAYGYTDKIYARRHYQEDTTGTTAVVVVATPSSLFVANAGDSRAVLGSIHGDATPLTTDHKPVDPAERQRIEDAGGFVSVDPYGPGRVLGLLSVSRAIGDVSLKPYVSPTPDVIEHTLEARDHFLLMACDGLWDVVDNSEAARFVAERLRTDEAPRDIVQALVQHAMQLGTQDNVTVLLAVRPVPA
jgi:serine/threonine protein phosphatase PrpC